MTDASQQFLAEYNRQGIKSSLEGKFSPMSGSEALVESEYLSVGITDTSVTDPTTSGTGTPAADIANQPVSAQGITNLGADWNLLNEVVLTSASLSFSCDFPERRHIMFIIHTIGNTLANSTHGVQFNYDTGANYGYLPIINGVASAGTSGANQIDIQVNTLAADGAIQIQGYIMNEKTIDTKLVRLNVVAGNQGSSGAPIYVNEIAANWYKSLTQGQTAITSVTMMITSGGSFIPGSRIAVYGSST